MPQRGLIQRGNINLYDRPHVRNPDGSISTVRSVSFGIGGKEVLVPTVSDDGRILSNDEALAAFKRTGKQLGIFDSPASANRYAVQLHNDYAAGKYDRNGARMPRRMVAPNGEVRMIDDADIAKAMAGGAVNFGSPEHMALIGTPGPSTPQGIPQPDMPSDVGRALGRGIVKGAVSSGAGMFRMVPERFYSERSKQGLREMEDFGTAIDAPEKIGKGAEQIAEFALPAFAGSRAAKAVNVAERVMQTRNAAGQFLKATRSPVAADLVKRAAAKVAAESAASGIVNKAQGGDFVTGAGAGAAASAIPMGVVPARQAIGRGIQTVTAPITSNLILRRAAGNAIGYGALGAGGLGIYSGKLDSSTALKAAMLAAFLHPTTAGLVTRGTAAAGLNLLDRQPPGTRRTVRQPVNSRMSYMGGDGHENIGE